MWARDITTSTSFWNPLCITLPKASRTAWDVKFSEGIRLMKCFCLRFSYISNQSSKGSFIRRGTYILEDLVDSGIGMLEVCREELWLQIKLALEHIGQLSWHAFCWDSAVMDDTARLKPHIGEVLQAAVLRKDREAPLKRDMMICTSQSINTATEAINGTHLLVQKCTPLMEHRKPLRVLRSS